MKDYHINVFYSDEDAGYIADIPDLKYCSAFGESPEEAVRAFLREEVKKNSWGTIHEAIIGKIDKALIGMILEEEKGNQVRAAKRLGINRNTLRKKMKDLQITTRVITGFGGN